MDSVANRYAVALLSVAREENKIQEYVNQIEQLKAIIKSNPELLVLLRSYSLSSDEKKDAITKCFKNKIDEYILNFFYVLIDNSRTKYILEIFNEFVKKALNELNIKKGVVYTTTPLNANQMQLLSKKVSDTLCCKVVLENEIDKDLLGGFKIQVEDYILDDSLKNRLAKLKDELILKKGENA